MNFQPPDSLEFIHSRPSPLSAPAERLALQSAFFAKLGGRQVFQALFNHLPDVHFFAKDAQGRFMAGSRGLLLRLGYDHEHEIIGMTDSDFHPPRTVCEIREDDLRVMQTLAPLVDRVEALFSRNQARDWYVTTKLPVVAPNGEVLGVMGFVRLCLNQTGKTGGMKRLDPIVAHIQENHHRAVSPAELSTMAAVSVRQLHRLFRDVYGMSTEAFIIRTRVQAAGESLLHTDKPISQIAGEHGFCDQSAFTRRFREHTGETPLKFRQRGQRLAGRTA